MNFITIVLKTIDKILDFFNQDNKKRLQPIKVRVKK